MKPGLLASLACAVIAACGTGAPTPTSTQAPTQTIGAQTITPGPATSSPAPSGSATPTPALSPTPQHVTAWTRLTQATAGPPAREDHTWTVVDDVAYLFGGRTADGPANDLWAFSLTTNEWHELRPSGPAPAPRFGHTGTAVPGVGLVIWSGQGSSFFDDIWAYDPGVDAWHELPSLGPDGRLWISHGFTRDDGRFDDTRAYDFATGEWTDETPAGDRPVKRCLHDCYWSAAGTLILYGGQTTGIPALGDIWSYDSAAEAWAEGPAVAASPRQLYALAPEGNLVFGGGTLDGGFLADTWRIDPLTLQLTQVIVETGPSARSGSTLLSVLAADRMLLFGGQNETGVLSDVWALSAAP